MTIENRAGAARYLGDYDPSLESGWGVAEPFGPSLDWASPQVDFGALQDAIVLSLGVAWVVSDGVETCGGDAIAAARALHEGGAKVVVNIVGFDVPARDRAALEAVAKAGGGVFKEARTGRDLERVLAEGRELRGRLMAEARASSATALNTMRTNMAINRMNACLRQRMLQESQRLRLRTLAKTDPAIMAAAEEATRLLDDRHARVRALADDYAEALGKADAQMAERVAQDLRRALAGQGR